MNEVWVIIIASFAGIGVCYSLMKLADYFQSKRQTAGKIFEAELRELTKRVVHLETDRERFHAHVYNECKDMCDGLADQTEEIVEKLNRIKGE